MFNRRSYETDGPPRHDTSDAMANGGQFLRSIFNSWNLNVDTGRSKGWDIRIDEEVLMEDPTIEGQRPEHA